MIGLKKFQKKIEHPAVPTVHLVPYRGTTSRVGVVKASRSRPGVEGLRRKRGIGK